MHMRDWQQAGIHLPRVAINYSAKEIEQKDFVDNIIHALKKHELPLQAFEIEVTESVLIHDMDNTINKMKQLHEAGIHIAIDDFGTGYSSLSLLQKLPINRLKIDRSFIQDMEEETDRSIIEAIAHMSRGLGLEMVAEGVEQEYQLRYLQQLKCPVVQGYVFSQGVPADEVRKFIQSTRQLLEQHKLSS